MNFLGKLFGHTSPDETKAAPALPAPTLSDATSFREFVFGARQNDSLNISVTPETAMRCTPVRAAVLAISEAVGQLPLITYKRLADGSKERAPEHGLYDVLRNRSNEGSSAQTFREQLTRDALLYGNAFALINKAGSITELWRLDPRSVTVELDGWLPTYRVSLSDGSQRTYQAGDVFHLRGSSVDGVKGDSPIAQCERAIRLALLLEAHGELLFKNRAQPGGVISVDVGLDAAKLDAIRTAWKETYGGGKNYGVSLMPGFNGFTPIAFSSTDAQYLELRAFAVNEIARIFRVPPHMIFDLGRATWANSAEMGAEFLTYALRPWLLRWESEIALKLFTDSERHVYFAEFLSDDLTRMDIAARSQAYSTMIASRILSPNEVRARENLTPYEGGDKFINPNTTSTAPVTGESN